MKKAIFSILFLATQLVHTSEQSNSEGTLAGDINSMIGYIQAASHNLNRSTSEALTSINRSRVVHNPLEACIIYLTNGHGSLMARTSDILVRIGNQRATNSNTRSTEVNTTPSATEALPTTIPAPLTEQVATSTINNRIISPVQSRNSSRITRQRARTPEAFNESNSEHRRKNRKRK